MSEEGLKEAVKSPEAFGYLVYKGIEGAINGLEEYKISKKAFIQSKGNFIGKNFGNLIQDYADKLPFLERVAVRTLLSIQRTYSQPTSDYPRQRSGMIS